VNYQHVAYLINLSTKTTILDLFEPCIVVTENFNYDLAPIHVKNWRALGIIKTCSHFTCHLQVVGKLLIESSNQSWWNVGKEGCKRWWKNPLKLWIEGDLVRGREIEGDMTITNECYMLLVLLQHS